MTEENDSHKEKIITLNKLNSQEYRLGKMKAHAILDVYEVLNIVEDKEPDSIPQNPDETVRAITQQLRSRVEKGNGNHDLTRKALLKCLESAELLKVSTIQDSASEIGNRLKEKYDQVLDIEYIRADYALHALTKDNQTSMNDHINQFIKLLQDLEYHKPENASAKDKEVINFTFINSLNKDGNTFQQVKDASLRDMKTSALFAKVKAIDAGKLTSREIISLEAKALDIYFDENQGDHDNRERERDEYNNKKCEYNRDHSCDRDCKDISKRSKGQRFYLKAFHDRSALSPYKYRGLSPLGHRPFLNRHRPFHQSNPSILLSDYVFPLTLIKFCS